MITQQLTKEESNKAKNDLQFIALITRAGKERKCRVVIGGGYAVDGALGQITRPHADIDIQIFGQDGNAKVLIQSLLQEVESTLVPYLEDKGRKEFYHYFFVPRSDGAGAEFYYIQVLTDPHANEKIVVKSDGLYTRAQTYATEQATIEGITYEIQNPTIELVDKLYKRTIRMDEVKEKHSQDIENLKLITNHEVITEKLKSMR